MPTQNSGAARVARTAGIPHASVQLPRRAARSAPPSTPPIWSRRPRRNDTRFIDYRASGAGPRAWMLGEMAWGRRYTAGGRGHLPPAHMSLFADERFYFALGVEQPAVGIPLIAGLGERVARCFDVVLEHGNLRVVPELQRR